MRKVIAVIAVIVLCMLTGTASYGAVSEDVYVRKDVFEVYMQSVNSKFDIIIEELKAQREEMKAIRQDVKELSQAVSGLSERVTALSGRIEGVNTTLSGRIDGLNASLSGRIDGLDKRIDDLRNDIYLGFVLLGIIVAWPRAREVLQKIGKSAPSITLEDVRRLIEENNAMLERKIQA